MKRLSVLGVIALSLLFSGCPVGTTKTEEAWVTQFKKDLAQTERRFFASNYILNSNDPFYISKLVSRLSADKRVPRGLSEQIDNAYDDFAQSWPILAKQLKRTQMIFTITAVLPSLEANILLAKELPAGFDREVASLIGQFRTSVERGTVFVESRGGWRPEEFPGIASVELTPETRAEVVSLASKITARTLWLIASVRPSQALSDKKELIRILSAEAAAEVGQPLVSEQLPYIEAPTELWAELKTKYDQIFALLRKAVRQQSGRQKLLDEIARLRGEEKAIVEKLHFATEKQFAIANVIIGKK